MAASVRPSAEHRALLEMLTTAGDGPMVRDRLEYLHTLREQSKQTSLELDYQLVQEVHRLRAGLARAQEHQEHLSGLLERLTAPPVHPAIFLGWVTTPEWGEVAMVS